MKDSLVQVNTIFVKSGIKIGKSSIKVIVNDINTGIDRQTELILYDAKLYVNPDPILILLFNSEGRLIKIIWNNECFPFGSYFYTSEIERFLDTFSEHIAVLGKEIPKHINQRMWSLYSNSPEELQEYLI
ncbi:hypothetical protein DRQ09_00020 [candidate division KSB1 bacterium]|nr:MAG: hypothetical protein DRQ09_00020 [candidate division KSB1 bacterium]